MTSAAAPGEAFAMLAGGEGIAVRRGLTNLAKDRPTPILSLDVGPLHAWCRFPAPAFREKR